MQLKKSLKMKINKIKLTNFKSYYDSNELDLSVTDDRNVIVIYADSGFGKTTLLEAINWALYGQFFINKLNKSKKSSDKITVDKWISETHLKEVIAGQGNGEMSVEINYDYKNEKHIIFNTIKFTADSFENINITSNEHILKKLPDGGNWTTSTNLEVDVNRVLPKNIVDYFFFDAEKQSRLVMPSKQDLVQDAIYNVIGLINLENSAKNLKEIAKNYSKDLGRIDLGEVSKLTTRKTELETIIENDEEEIEIIKKNIKALKDNIDVIDMKLLGHKETEKYQSKIEELKNDKADLLLAKRDLEDKLAALNYTSSPLIIEEHLKALQKNLIELRKSGKIPGIIRLNLLEEILDKDECICGTDLKSNITNKNIIEKLKIQVAKQSKEKDKLLDINSTVNMFASEVSTRNRNEIAQLVESYDKINEAIANIEDQIQINEDHIGEVENENIKELKESKERFDDERGILQFNLGSLEEKIKNNNSELDDVNIKLEKSVIVNERAIKLQSYEKLARTTSEELTAIFDTFASMTRSEISTIAEQQWKKLIKSTKKLNFNIDESFKFNIRDSLGRNAINELSNGQKQGLVLSFVSAISEVSQKFPPYIIDMPFGRLGEESQKEAAIFMPNACKQLILLLNKQSEYNDTTMAVLRPKCNKLIELDFNSDSRITNIIIK